MSRMFGPIHHWLFDQIRIVDRRCTAILAHFSESLGKDELSNLNSKIDTSFGKSIADFDLENLVFPLNIHEGLSRLIDIVEAREAAAVAAFNDNKDVLDTIYQHQGRILGEKLAESIDGKISTAPELFQLLQQVVLVGMPCDQVLQVTSSTDNEITWIKTECLQERNWKRTGADSELMMLLHSQWLKAFIASINSNAVYELRNFNPEEKPASSEAIVIE